MFMPELPLELLLLLLLLQATESSANALPSRSAATRKLFLMEFLFSRQNLRMSFETPESEGIKYSAKLTLLP
jgi:hypothetical protein